MALEHRDLDIGELPMPRNPMPPKSNTSFVRIDSKHRLMALNLSEVWRYRELLYFLIWRDVKVKYKQTAIGAAWAIVQPLLNMFILTIVFSRLAKVPSDGIPYPLFSYTALLPWNLFAGALSNSTTSIVGQSHLISKVYFPRLIIPIAVTLSGLVDFGIAMTILAGMVVWYGIVPGWSIALLPLFMLLALAAALSLGLWLGALNVRYRDVGHAIPFLVQFWMFASPIAYPASLIHEKWRFLYGLNPMTGVIEGFRWAVLGKTQPDLSLILLSALIVVGLLFGGIVYFKRMEETFADLV